MSEPTTVSQASLANSGFGLQVFVSCPIWQRPDFLGVLSALVGAWRGVDDFVIAAAPETSTQASARTDANSNLFIVFRDPLCRPQTAQGQAAQRPEVPRTVS